MTDLLKQQQEAFKEQVDELYYICEKMESRIEEFTAKQVELLEENERNVRAVQNNIITSLQDEAAMFEKARMEIIDASRKSGLMSYVLYIFCAITLVASSMSMWVSYTDISKRPQELSELCRQMTKGKYVTIDPESVKKKVIAGKEYTIARISD